MSTRNRAEVKKQIAALIIQKIHEIPVLDIADKILAIPELAVVDREAILVESDWLSKATLKSLVILMQRIAGEHWVREILDDKT